MFAALLLFSPAAAQTEVRMMVSDSATSEPIEGALVEVTRADGTLAWRGFSGGDGHATTRLTPGEFVVTSSMLGYSPVGPITVRIPDQSSIRLRILHQPEAVALEPLNIEIARRRWPAARDRWGFEWRRIRRPVGLFMEAGERDLRAVTSMSTLLRRFTGVRVIEPGFGSPVVLMREASLASNAFGSGALYTCGPSVFRDGFRIHNGGRGDPAPIDELISISDVKALEIYRGSAEVPPEFKAGPGSCGAIIVWTK
jgi:hypothetical protein